MRREGGKGGAHVRPANVLHTIPGLLLSPNKSSQLPDLETPSTSLKRCLLVTSVRNFMNTYQQQ